MGGSNKQTTETQQNTKQDPWAPAIPGLTNIVNGVNALPNTGVLSNTETGALNTLQGRADAGNPWATRIGGVADNLLSGGANYNNRATDAFNTLNTQLSPTANGAYLDPNTNPFFAQTTAALSKDAMDRVNALYAGSGRDSSGAGSFAYNAGKGITEATAPVYASVYNNERTNQLNAAGTLYGGANTSTGLLSSLDQTRLGNQQQGVNAATAAQQALDAPQLATLNIEAQRRGIPLQSLASAAGLLTPIAQLGGTGQSNTTSTTTQQTDPTRAIIGGIMGGAGLLMGNPMGALGMGSAMGSLMGGGGSAGFGGTPPSYMSGGYSPALNAPTYSNPYGGSWYG